jgi:glycosyltransferase involved in cell wall biosynthesis
MDPSVSVIIPTYNRAHYLRNAIESVLNQTFRPCELIVVDDHSSDNTFEVISGFGDSGVRGVRHEFNRGISAARNTGIIKSRGRYVAFLDDDDEWLPQKLEAQVGLIETSQAEVGVVYCGYRILDRGTGDLIRLHVPVGEDRLAEQLHFRNCIGTCSSPLFRRECFEAVGLFDERLSYGEDWDVYIRVAARYRFKCIGPPLLNYYTHASASLSKNNPGRIQNSLEILRTKHSLTPLSEEDLGRQYLHLGALFCGENNMRAGRQMILKAIRMHPGNWRYYCNYLISIPGASFYHAFRRLRRGLE